MLVVSTVNNFCRSSLASALYWELKYQIVKLQDRGRRNLVVNVLV